MIIRAAREGDAPAMGQVMVTTYLAAHRGQMPDEAWAKRVEEWTPEVSADGWARTLREIASGQRSLDCIYVAVDDSEIVGLAVLYCGQDEAHARPGKQMRGPLCKRNRLCCPRIVAHASRAARCHTVRLWTRPSSCPTAATCSSSGARTS